MHMLLSYAFYRKSLISFITPSFSFIIFFSKVNINRWLFIFNSSFENIKRTRLEYHLGNTQVSYCDYSSIILWLLEYHTENTESFDVLKIMAWTQDILIYSGRVFIYYMDTKYDRLIEIPLKKQRIMKFIGTFPGNKCYSCANLAECRCQFLLSGILARFS